MSPSRHTTVVGGLAAVGAHRIWAHTHSTYVRRRVLRTDRDQSYDAYLACLRGGGEPLLLTSPTAESTLFYFEGFRSRWVAGMYGIWLRDLHERLDVNVVAPLIGLHGLPYRQRNLPWDYRLDIRQAVQLYDIFLAAQAPGHRVTLMSSCAGSLCVLALLAARPVDRAILVAPAAAGFRAPRRMKPYARLLVACGVGHLVFPTYYRGVVEDRVGNWDVFDQERRRAENATTIGNREWNAAQFNQLIRGSRWADRQLVPRIRDKRITVIWGENDNFIPPRAIARLARTLGERGNIVTTLTLPKTGHMVLMDRARGQVHRLVEHQLGEAAPPGGIR
jgi:pimeloyl-ACP methyl ester carboxylesterase